VANFGRWVCPWIVGRVEAARGCSDIVELMLRAQCRMKTITPGLFLRRYRPVLLLGGVLFLGNCQEKLNWHGSVALFSQSSNPTKPAEIGVSSDKLEVLNAALQNHIDQGELAGVVTLISRHGKVAQLKAYGLMDIKAKKPTRIDALFRIASMNKIFTSVGALTLYEQGRFQLDDPVSKYISGFKKVRVLESNPPGAKLKMPLQTVPLARDITIRDLFRHTAGFVYAFGKTPLDELYRQAGFQVWDKSLTQFVERLAEQPLAYQPGSRWEYSYSIDVLGSLIEVVSGLHLDEFMEQRVFGPLQMRDTGYFVPPDKVHRFANHYEFKDGKLQLVDAALKSSFRYLPTGLSGGGGWETGYGGVVTTAADLGRFLQMVLNRGELERVRILKTRTVDMMVSNQITNIHDRSFPVSGYGLGVGVEPDPVDPQTTRMIFWAGGPYNTSFWVDLKRGMFGIFLTQTAPFRHLGVMDEFRKLSTASALE